MKPMRIILPVLIGAGLVLLYLNGRFAVYQKQQSLRELEAASMLVEQQIRNDASRIVRQLNGFSRTVSGDRDFSMKLIVEGDRSAPEVSEIAQRHMESMDFSLLVLADSSLGIISCGQFTAAVGTIITPGAAMLDTQGVFLFDDVRGQNIFSLQARVRFTIAETPLYSIGGITVDNTYLLRLRPRSDMLLVVKQDKFIISTDTIQSMSDLNNNEMTINNTTYLASAIPLQYAGKGEPPVLYVLMKKQAPSGILSLR